MSIRLLCGPAGSGKIGLVTERFLELCEGEQPWLIVPTITGARRITRELLESRPALVGGRVGTFPHLVRSLVPAEAVGELSEAAQRVIVERVVRAQSARIPAARYPGFASSAGLMIDELRRVRLAGGDAGEVFADATNRERAMWYGLLDAYEAELASSGQSDAALLEYSAAAAARSISSHDAVLVHGFDDFSEPQLALLEALGAHSEVVVSLPFEPGRIVFERRQAFVDRLTAGGARVQHVPRGSGRVDVLNALEGSLYEPEASAISPTGEALQFVDCCGPMQEAEEVVRAVARFRSQGVAGERIACISAHPRGARPQLEVCFRSAGIPVDFEISRGLSETPAGRAVVDLCASLVANDLPRFLAFARSRVSGIDASVVERWSAQQVGDSGPWIDAPWVPQEMRAAALALRDSSSGITEVVAALGTLIPCTTGDARLLRSVASSLIELERQLGAAPLAKHELATALDAVRIPAPGRRDPGVVIVSSIADVRIDDFDAVILFGMHSGALHVDGDEDDAPAIARELMYTACTRAREHLTVIRQRAAADGRLRAPHPAWLELRRLAPNEQFLVHERRLDQVVPPPDAVVLSCEVSRSLAAAHGGAASDADANVRDVVQAISRVRPKSSDAGDEMRAAIEASAALSVTDIEGYVGCPSRWMIDRHLLRTAARTTTTRQMVGELVHDVLAAVVPVWAREVDSAEQLDDTRRKTDIDTALDVASQKMSARRRAPHRGEVEYARFVCERFTREEFWFGDRVETEVAFGDDEGAIASFELNGIRLRGRIDRIDFSGNRAVLHDYKLRGDAEQGKWLVREGKVQALIYWLALARHADQSIQPVGALYRPLEGSRSRGVVEGAAGIAVPNGFKNDHMTHDAIEGILEEVETLTRATIEHIRTGVVTNSPRGGECPKWCHYQAICRIDEVAE